MSDRKWQIKETSQVKLVTTKVLMLQQTFQRMTSSRHAICLDISNICRNIKFRGYHRKARKLCRNNISFMSRQSQHTVEMELCCNIEIYCHDKG